MLHQLGSEPMDSDFTALHATIWANSPICQKSQPLRSWLVMLYWFQKFSKFKNQQSMNI